MQKSHGGHPCQIRCPHQPAEAWVLHRVPANGIEVSFRVDSIWKGGWLLQRGAQVQLYNADLGRPVLILHHCRPLHGLESHSCTGTDGAGQHFLFDIWADVRHQEATRQLLVETQLFEDNALSMNEQAGRGAGCAIRRALRPIREHPYSSGLFALGALWGAIPLAATGIAAGTCTFAGFCVSASTGFAILMNRDPNLHTPIPEPRIIEEAQTP